MNEPDWNNKTLRMGAVDAALWELSGRTGAPVPLKRIVPGALTGIATTMGIAAETLAEWCRCKDLRPSGAILGDYTPHDDESRETALTAAAAAAPLLPEGGLPGGMPDPFEALLSGEDDALSERERAELAEALEGGVALRRPQRLALAVMLRGSGLQDRRAIVRAMLEFVIPREAEAGEAWTPRATDAGIPAGGKVAVIPAAAVVPGRWRRGMGAQHVAIADAAGRVVRVVLYARIREQSATVAKLMHLVPAQRFSTETVSIRLALLKSWVTGDGAKQTGWAHLFDTDKQRIGYHAGKLKEQLGVPLHGQLAKPQRSKGRRVKA